MIAFASLIGVVAFLRLLVMLTSVWFDAKMEVESMNLITIWTHSLNERRKVNLQFTTDDESLVTLASQRVEPENSPRAQPMLVMESIDNTSSSESSETHAVALRKSSSTASTSTSSLFDTATPQWRRTTQNSYSRLLRFHPWELRCSSPETLESRGSTVRKFLI